MTARFQGIVRRLSPLILLLACGLPAQAQDRAALQQQLSERVDQIYQLFVSGDWSKVDAYITDDSRNIWLAQAKNTIEAFEIDELTVAPVGQKADVTVMISYRVPQFPGAPFSQPQKTEWFYQGGEWFVQLKPPPFPDGPVHQGQHRRKGLPHRSPPSGSTKTPSALPVRQWASKPL